MANLFDNQRAFAPFEEPVAVSAHMEDSDGIRRIGTVHAAVLLGDQNSQSAGAIANPKTAQLYAVRIRKTEWDSAFAFPPRFGMRFDTSSFGLLVVDSVSAGKFTYECRCSNKQKARDK